MIFFAKYSSLRNDDKNRKGRSMNWKNIVIGIVAAGAIGVGAADLNNADAWSLSNGWKAEKGAIAGSSKGNIVARPKAKTAYKKVEFEASLTPVKAVAPHWKVAGIQIVDGKNFWQLALIEAPDKAKHAKKHFIELKELYKGKWGGESKLKRLLLKTNKWDYGKTYKLKIKMDDKRIDGYATDEKGKEIAHIAYALKPVAVTSGSPALRVVCMDVKFSDIKVKGEKK